MNAQDFILQQTLPFTVHSILNDMIDRDYAVNLEDIEEAINWLRVYFRIMPVGLTPFDEDVFEVVRVGV